MIDGLPVSDRVKADAQAVYGIIADAESRVHGHPVDQIHFHEVGTTDAVADVVGVCMLMEALGELTEEEQEIVLLSVVAGLKSREIGEITGKAAGTIRSSQSRSLAKMRAFMEG